jgi:hypothetical protein
VRRPTKPFSSVKVAPRVNASNPKVLTPEIALKKETPLPSKNEAPTLHQRFNRGGVRGALLIDDRANNSVHDESKGYDGAEPDSFRYN